jgi:hypothetical protein
MGEKLFSGMVVASSGAVVNDEGSPILIFLNGFCRGDGGDSFYDDDFSKSCMWLSRSSQKDGCRDI